VAQGTPEQVVAAGDGSHTARYLKGALAGGRRPAREDG
jgi:excinuclease UvrABC ATPase subunit